MTTEPNQDPAAQSAPVENDTPHPDGQLAAQLAAANEELSNLRESMLRERADLENQRKRLTRDVEMARKFANERLLSALLPVIDSLEAGLQASGDDAVALRQGVELTLRQLLKVTGDNGLVEVNPAGQPFNPEHHEAMSTVASAEHPPGHVVQVYQKGWLLNERLLRPALVVVSGDA
ncbi:nucleotide exchange factor GrpE [Novilysobacter antarcticus]|uniref:nucleotide exchange factor GrpE n=1 Tax=Novilysobacter antarcticus TaxID=2862543 RepID=UPI001C9A1D21|nr:nucleotide exchange factor GrpE [Lysobacter antarcticus]